jgi:hypothetical protein
MAKLYNGKSQYVEPGDDRVMHVGKGKVHQVIASCTGSTAGAFTLFDDTVVGGNILLRVVVHPGLPVVLTFPPGMPLKFEAGLAVQSSAEAFVIVEAL